MFIGSRDSRRSNLSEWIGFSAGYMLAAFVGGMALLTALVGWRIHHTVSVSMVPASKHRWARAIGISLLSLIILAWYPVNLTQSLPGELLTVIVSVTLFFAAVRAWKYGSLSLSRNGWGGSHR
jgi:hypothetical protein